MKSRKFGFTGPDSTGKSELIANIALHYTKTRSLAVLSIGNIARKSPFTLADRQTFESSQWIIHNVVEEERKASQTDSLVLCDRTLFDIWVFSKMAADNSVMSADQLQIIEAKVNRALLTYEAIFLSTIDASYEVQKANLYEGREEIRDLFAQLIPEGVVLFENSCRFIKLPSESKTRLACVRDIIDAVD